jgi:protoporphyrinogen oxidase
LDLLTVGRFQLHTVILGTGISGLTAAYALSGVREVTSSVYEQDSVAGGLCRTHKQDGFAFDAVSHVLHFRSAEAEQLVRTILDGNLSRHERKATIYFRERHVPYPFQTHLGFLPFRERLSCLLGYLGSRIARWNGRAPDVANFEEWINRHFGRGIARHFMTPYNTKLWGVPPREMSADWVRPFVPTMSVSQVLQSLNRRTSNPGYNSSFLYPQRGGIQELLTPA